MKFESKNLKETEVEFKINLDRQELMAAEEQALRQIGKTSKIKGFREGKAPINVVKQNTDPNKVADKTLEIAVNQYLTQAFDENKIIPLDQPHVTIEKFIPEQELEFRATFEVLPKVKLPNYKRLKVKKEVVKVTDKEVTDTLERVRQSFAEEKEVKRAVKSGDKAEIDFKGFKDGKAFAGGEGKNYPLSIGSNTFIPGFEEQIIGHKAGEEFDIEVTFPKDYGEKSLAGAKARFEIKLHRVLEVTPPKLDDELAKKTKMFKTLDELKADIRKNLIVSKEEAATEDFKNRLVEALAKQTKAAIPNVLRDDQIHGLEQEFRQNLTYRGTTLEKFLENTDKTYETWRKEELEPAAETRVKAGLALAEIAKELEIKITDSEVEDQINQLRTQYAKNESTIKQLDNPRVVHDIRSNLITKKAIDWLVEFNS